MATLSRLSRFLSRATSLWGASAPHAIHAEPKRLEGAPPMDSERTLVEEISVPRSEPAEFDPLVVAAAERLPEISDAAIEIRDTGRRTQALLGRLAESAEQQGTLLAGIAGRLDRTAAGQGELKSAIGDARDALVDAAGASARIGLALEAIERSLAHRDQREVELLESCRRVCVVAVLVCTASAGAAVIMAGLALWL